MADGIEITNRQRGAEMERLRLDKRRKHEVADGTIIVDLLRGRAVFAADGMFVRFVNVKCLDREKRHQGCQQQPCHKQSFSRARFQNTCI